MPFSPRTLLPIAASFVLALVLTPVVRMLARRYGAVATPKTDRWHKRPTAMLGGIAIWLAVPLQHRVFVPHTTYFWVILRASSFLFLVGLVDDIFHIKPYQKLIGQILGAAYVVYYGLSLPWSGSALLNMALAIFWLIGITNAINLLDNMDGLASGIAVIAAGFLAVGFIDTGQLVEAYMLMAFGGALLGFLVYNSNPASIFMGDCGSMFVGFFSCELRTRKYDRRSNTQSPPGAGGSDPCTLHTNLRHSVRYGHCGSCPAVPLHQGGRDHYLSSSGCSGNVRATRSDDALWICRALRSHRPYSCSELDWMSV